MSPACIYSSNVNNENARTVCEICSKLTIRTPERRRHFGVFDVYSEQISLIVLIISLLTFNKYMQESEKGIVLISVRDTAEFRI